MLNDLGLVYLHGRGAKKDVLRAVSYFKRAVKDVQSADAAFNLGGYLFYLNLKYFNPPEFEILHSN